ncbi:ATP-binding cassette domain-containing protein [Geminicoccaceae bacterium 1502E]|nr:ATP-binding cassette domain-containing protein [Geminicoccaceae bacterium 1502E]
MFLARLIAATAPGEPLLPLRVESLTFEAGGARLLDGVSLTLGQGMRTVVMGPNGAGKSLLLRLCHGLLRPTRGRVRWALDDGEAVRRRQAFVFQRPVLLRRSTLANVTFALAHAGVTLRGRRDRAMEALERVGLGHLAGRPARLLSGGEQQRVALARAWAIRPDVLFLDEATASLDPSATRTIEGIVQAMHEAGVKIVLTTHDLGQARRLGDEIVFLHKGRLVEHQPAAAFFERPRSEQARAFLDGRLME